MRISYCKTGSSNGQINTCETGCTRCVPTSGYFLRHKTILRTSNATCTRPRARWCCRPRPSAREVLTRFRRRYPPEHRSRKSPNHRPAPSRCSLRHPRAPCARAPFVGGTWRPSPVDFFGRDGRAEVWGCRNKYLIDERRNRVNGKKKDTKTVARSQDTRQKLRSEDEGRGTFDQVDLS